jgi:hypothetical protein
MSTSQPFCQRRTEEEKNRRVDGQKNRRTEEEKNDDRRRVMMHGLAGKKGAIFPRTEAFRQVAKRFIHRRREGGAAVGKDAVPRRQARGELPREEVDHEACVRCPEHTTEQRHECQTTADPMPPSSQRFVFFFSQLLLSFFSAVAAGDGWMDGWMDGWVVEQRTKVFRRSNLELPALFSSLLLRAVQMTR